MLSNADHVSSTCMPVIHHPSTRMNVLQIESSQDIDEEMDGIIKRQMEKHPHELLHTVGFY